MHYIILDLEWNQPMSYQSHVYREVGDRLIFEMIQIGAVKLDDSLAVVDSISIPIRPVHYVKIHPRIRRMTQLGAEELADAPEFLEAMRQFVAWCGEDYALLTWGCDDVSVLKQNMDFFQCQEVLPPPVRHSEAVQRRNGLQGPQGAQGRHGGAVHHPGRKPQLPQRPARRLLYRPGLCQAAPPGAGAPVSAKAQAADPRQPYPPGEAPRGNL